MTVTVNVDQIGIARHTKDGVYHREDGPAIDCLDCSEQNYAGQSQFWLNGNPYSFADWLKKVEHNLERGEGIMLKLTYT